jgi:hypothetical protein
MPSKYVLALYGQECLLTPPVRQLVPLTIHGTWSIRALTTATQFDARAAGAVLLQVGDADL